MHKQVNLSTAIMNLNTLKKKVCCIMHKFVENFSKTQVFSIRVLANRGNVGEKISDNQDKKMGKWKRVPLLTFLGRSKADFYF